MKRVWNAKARQSKSFLIFTCKLESTRNGENFKVYYWTIWKDSDPSILEIAYIVPLSSRLRRSTHRKRVKQITKYRKRIKILNFRFGQVNGIYSAKNDHTWRSSVESCLPCTSHQNSESWAQIEYHKSNIKYLKFTVNFTSFQLFFNYFIYMFHISN